MAVFLCCTSKLNLPFDISHYFSFVISNRDPAGQHHKNHLVVAHERPQRILKRCRLVLLDEEMANPGGPISRDERERKKPPLVNEDKDNNSTQCDRGTDEVQQTCARLAVLSQVVRPEFSE